MRVIHVSSTDVEGGAARAALRLHNALLQAGAASSMLVRKKRSSLPFVQELPPAQDRRDSCAHLAQHHYIDRNRTPCSNTYFSLAWPGLDLTQHPAIRQADVIHLHWVWDFQSAATLGALMRLAKPVVWSFHDQRALTGGCHYSAGCQGYRAACEHCPQLAGDPAGLTAAALADQRLFWPAEAVTVVGLSRWMADCARQSSMWRTARIEVIPNSVETEVFAPRTKRECREEFGLPPDAVCFLVAADYFAEIRKGFRELLHALKICMADPEFAALSAQGRLRLLSVGNPAPELYQSPLPILSLGYIREDKRLAEVYSAADLFVLPSLEDNLPNTVLEAMSCGTPVAAFDSGGVRDMVTEGVTGYLAPVGDAAKLADILLRVSHNRDLARKLGPSCRERVQREFAPELQARRFLDLYSDLRPWPAESGGKRVASQPPTSLREDRGPALALALPAVWHRVFTNAAVEFPPELCQRLASIAAEGVSGARPFHEVINSLEHSLTSRESRWLRCWKKSGLFRRLIRQGNGGARP